MGFSKEKKEHIKEFLLKCIYLEKPIYEEAEKTFGISRTTVNNYLKELAEQNLITVTGGVTQKQYTLKETKKEFHIEDLKNQDEQTIYDNNLKDLVENQKENIKVILIYALTEMINNAIDHSGSKILDLLYIEDYFTITFLIADDGVGIFKKIMNDHNLNSEDEAIFELRKGKLTSDTENHSGEGIFFTSRAVDYFHIYSGNKVFYCVTEKERIRSHDLDVLYGTCVSLCIHKNSKTILKDVFDKYTDDDYNFDKTEVTIRLVDTFPKILMSRSLGKRVVSRIEKFKEVVLDYNGVEEIGQGFADEIYRIFTKVHPDVNLININCNNNISFMIERAKKTVVE